MNKGVLGLGIILLGSVALLIIFVISNYSTGGEVDYYLVKETSEAAMTEALDETFMSVHGIPRMDKELFMESFIRRFANNVTDTREYTIGFYGMNEVPPTVSVKVDSMTLISVKVGDEQSAQEITTSISQLVETNQTYNPSLTYQYTNKKSFIGSPITADGNQIILSPKVIS
ncbi:MAG: hypothetical protein IJL76_03280 [Bacilli bacterium]|nr:hypothetical protein [Bacilli bacterium]